MFLYDDDDGYDVVVSARLKLHQSRWSVWSPISQHVKCQNADGGLSENGEE